MISACDNLFEKRCNQLRCRPQAALHSICCNRLILQIKATSAQTQHQHSLASVPTSLVTCIQLREHETQGSDLEIQVLQ